MKQFSNYDYLYAVFMFLFGLFMIFSPGSLMRKAKYDKERIKTESWLKKTGIVLSVIAVLFGIYVYYKLNA